MRAPAAIARGSTSVRRLVRRHPGWAVFAAALAVRVLAAVVIAVVHDGLLIPDERQYLGLAGTVASGGSPDDWKAEYGPQLMSAVGSFTWPLTALFWLLSPWRILGQLLAALAGAAAAGLTTRLARSYVGPAGALLAGLAVALWPSQVLWSSVVLRESFVWLGIVLLAVGVRRAFDEWTDRGAAAGLVVVLLALLFLGHLRSQTFLVLAWAAAIASIAAVSARRAPHVLAVLAMVLLVPVTVDQGLGGADLVRRHLPNLDQTRAELSAGADSSFIPTTTSVRAVGREPSAGGGAPDRTTTTDGTPPEEEPTAAEGAEVVVIEDELGSLSAMPRGIVAGLLRPFPWEGTDGDADLLLAKLENLAWYALYVLAGIGCIVSRRRWRTIAFPVVAFGGMVAMNALIQGNLGTAFRHRAQLLPLLAVLAAPAVERWLDRRREAALTGG